MALVRLHQLLAEKQAERTREGLKKTVHGHLLVCPCAGLQQEIDTNSPM